MRPDVAGIIGESATVGESPERAVDAEKPMRTDPPQPLLPLRMARRRADELFEREYLSALLARADGNVTRAAALAEVSRQFIHKLLAKHHL
jgi:DNA-binding NtrC family response regulator